MIRNTQGTEDVVKKYENRLREVHTVPTNVQEVDNYCSELKVIFTALFCTTLDESSSTLYHVQGCRSVSLILIDP